MPKLESDYQSSLKDKIQKRLPESKVFKNGTDHNQGIPDLMILNGKKWAMLEVKASKDSRKRPRPNQEYFVDKYNKMGFAEFIYPEVEDDVLNRMTDYLRCQNDLE